MKRILFVMMVAATMLAACTKAPINGDLEGFWQLMRIETTTDTIDTRQYWAFQLRVMQLDSGYFFCRFEHKGGELRVYDIVAGEGNYFVDKGGEIEAPIGEADLKHLHKYGIYRLDSRFVVERLDNKAMRLRSEDACLYFRKY